MIAMHLIIGFPSEASAMAASAEFYNLSRPSFDPEKPSLGTLYALAWRSHPSDGTWAVELRDDFDMTVSALLRAEPERITPEAIAPLLTDPAATVAALAVSERIDAAFVLAQVKPALLLSPEDEGYSDWFPADEGT